MSKYNMEPITCPNCKTEHKIKVWESVNISMSPKEKEKILKGDFFKFKCKKCDFVAPLAYNCLYSDVEKKLAIWLIPELTDEIKEKLVAGDSLEGYTYRIVTTPNELKEKIAIVDAGLDDRIVELVKLVYLSQLNEEDVTEMFLEVQNEKEYAFVMFFEKKEPKIVLINNDVYAKVYEDFIEFVENESSNKFEEIDCLWAQNIFKKKI